MSTGLPFGAGASLREGLVIATHGRHCLVESADGERRNCHPRGKKSAVVVGDRVHWKPSEDEGSIEHVQERRNLFYRQDEMRTKSFAANLDQILLLLAAEPAFSERQLARSLIAAESQGIPVLIVLNKRDLQPAFDQAWARLDSYRRMGCAVLPLQLKGEAADAGPAAFSTSATAVASSTPSSASTTSTNSNASSTSTPSATSADLGLEALRQQLKGKVTLVLGPSGVGKSTLVNRWVPEARALTGEVSRALNSGKHTTTSTTWYWVDGLHSTALIDSPGFQEFGLNHIEPAHLAQCMPDLRLHLGHCRFYNCTHLHEPGCEVRAQVPGCPEHRPDPGKPSIDPSRYRIYSELFAELSERRSY